MLIEKLPRHVPGRGYLIFILLFFAAGVSFAEEDTKQLGSGLVKGTENTSTETEPDFFAVVGGQKLTKQDYLARLSYEIRQKFFHAKVPDEQMAKFRKQVGEEYINRVLLIQEAKKRGIKPEKQAVENRVARIEQKRKDDKYWIKNRERLLVGIREEFGDDSLLKLIKKQVREVAEPAEKDIKAYVKSNPEKFTIPERLKLATILLKVDPSSGGEVWRAATDEADRIVKMIREGADFSELARINSGHDSAASGGDMGYVHKGMLAKPAQEIINLMDPGDISEPIIILQGVAIFRLDERIKSEVNVYDRIKETAKGLLMRELGNQAWARLLKKLRAETKIEINESVYELPPAK